MAMALVSAVVEGLGSMAKDEVKLLTGVKEEIKKLSRMFTAINAVMEDAERQQVTKNTVRVWLENLKEVAYEVEDIIDEWRTEASRSKEDEDDFCNKVRSYILFLCLCFKDVKLQHDIGRRIRKITKRLDEISIQKRDFNLNEDNRQEEAESTPVKKERETSSFFDDSKIFGREKDQETIINELLNETSQEAMPISIVSIVGMGGLGKTTLAQLVYNDERVQKHFEKRIWVCVSDPFNVNTVATKIIQSMGGSTSQNQDLDTLQGNLREAVGKMRFLLVLDDVWDESGTQWEKLRLPLKGAARGSKIVITTRSHDVAKVMGTTHPHSLAYLPFSDCLELFKSRALEGIGDEECKGAKVIELMKVGEQIVERCKGVPLAIQTVGSLLGRKQELLYWRRIFESEIWEWKRHDETHDEGRILPALLLSYHSLPLHLKRCFPFCSLFPKDHEINKDELVQLWIAHGLIKSEREEIEEIGEMYFDDLLTLSLFQDAEEDNNDGNIVCCKVHDLVHDLAMFVATGDYCYMEIGNSKLHSVTFHHLTLDLNYEKEIPSPLCNAERLRTLLLRGGLDIEAVPDSLYKQLKFLRALDLSCTSIQDLPSLIGKLKHLRFLNLCNLDIKEVPEFVTDLCNLQTLKLDDCRSLCTLPSGMSKMVKLRHLGIINTPKLEFLPNGLGRLTSLRTLCKFPVGDDSRGCKIGELKNLNLLGGELNILNLERVMDAEEANKAELNSKCTLQNLSLHYVFKNDEERRMLGDDQITRMDSVLEALVPPHSSLKQLEILNYAGSKFPSWLGDLMFPNLVKITLDGCKWRLLPRLGKLPLLHTLRILKCPELEFLPEGLGQLTALQTLKIYNCSQLLYLPEGLGQLKALQTLGINNCNQLSSLPEGLGQLEALQRLVIIRCPQLSSLPKGVGQLKALWSLQIFDCPQLSSLPEGLGQLTALQTLTIITCSQLSSLPEGLGQLKALQTLDINNCNQLSSLPEGLGQLEALQRLAIISCPQLSSLPKGVGQLKALWSLQIFNCPQLSSLPEGLGQLKALRILKIALFSQLSSLPEGLGQLKALQTLDIQNCDQLSSLPEGLGQLKALQILDIRACNGVTSISNVLGQLKSLRCLRVFQCPNLKPLPNLQNLTMLEEIRIVQCPLVTQRLEKEKGADWCNISHIPSIWIDGRKIQ